MAGEGSLGERGTSPPLKDSLPYHGAFKRGETPLLFLPLSEQNNPGNNESSGSERGTKGGEEK